MAASKSYVIGNTVKLKNTIYLDDALIDPTTVTFVVEQPDGVDSSVTTATGATGIHTGTFKPTQAGWHKVEFKGVGNSADYLRERQFYVATSQQTAD